MTEPLHTPGPWHVDIFSGNPIPHWKNQPREVRGPDDQFVCAFMVPPRKDAPEQAFVERSNNAFWIAHVPEMIEAIRKVKHILTSAEEFGEEVDTADILAAVKKIPV